MTTAIQTLKRNAYAAVALLLLASAALPMALVANASAAELTNRSIDMSSSEPGASGQSYTIQFTQPATNNIQGVVIDFCAGTSTPLIGTECDDPGMTIGTTVDQFDIDGADDSSNWTAAAASGSTGDGVVLTRTGSATSFAATDVITIEVSGFTNPSATGTFYARILTFATTAGANGYESEDPDAVATPVDSGSVALSTALDIDVTARVNESLTFCVSGSAPDDGCTNIDDPDLTLGDPDEGLLSNAVSTATAHFQLSTNAANATAVKLRNSAASGGLNSGTNNIDPVDHASAPQTITAGTENFGVRVPVTSNGDLSTSVAGASPYASGTTTVYNMRATEVTSAYGDEIATASGPVSNVNVPLVFGATISNITPAGVYTAAIVLIATSTY